MAFKYFISVWVAFAFLARNTHLFKNFIEKPLI